MDRFIVAFSAQILCCSKILKSNMDRFIALYKMYIEPLLYNFKIQYGQIYSVGLLLIFTLVAFLKSNMDRFIGHLKGLYKDRQVILKSNMDRFIESVLWLMSEMFRFLKSNMDRFIDVAIFTGYRYPSSFKIQYGQIYRLTAKLYFKSYPILKSNMDRFIEN